MVGTISEPSHELILPDTGRLVSENGGPTNGGVQESADRERCITDHPTGKAKPRASGQHPVFWVEFQQFLGDSTVLPVNATANDLLDKVFEVPTMFHEIDRQPVQQLGVG